MYKPTCSSFLLLPETFDKLTAALLTTDVLNVPRILTYSMVQSPSWEANWSAASQEILRISRNPKVHYRTNKRPPPVSILGQPNPVHIPTPHLLEYSLYKSIFWMWIKNPSDATVCRYLFNAKLLYMFRVSQHPSSGVSKTWSDRDCVPIRPRWRRVAVQVVWPVPEAAGTVFDTHDGCCDTRNM